MCGVGFLLIYFQLPDMYNEYWPFHKSFYKNVHFRSHMKFLFYGIIRKLALTSVVFKLVNLPIASDIRTRLSVNLNKTSITTDLFDLLSAQSAFCTNSQFIKAKKIFGLKANIK